jgi:hypothetical protein
MRRAFPGLQPETGFRRNGRFAAAAKRRGQKRQLATHAFFDLPGNGFRLRAPLFRKAGVEIGSPPCCGFPVTDHVNGGHGLTTLPE